MLQFFSPNSLFGRWMAFFLDALLISILWAILCIPVVTIGPATAALNRVAHNWMQNRSECSVRFFWEAFLSNFKSALLIWLVLLVPLTLILFNGYAVWLSEMETTALTQWLTLLSAAVWMGTAIYAFALQALFENKPLRTVTNALRIAASYIVTTVILIALFAFAIFLTILFLPGAVFYVPICVFLSARPVWGVFRKVMQMPGVTTEAEGES